MDTGYDYEKKQDKQLIKALLFLLFICLVNIFLSRDGSASSRLPEDVTQHTHVNSEMTLEEKTTAIKPIKEVTGENKKFLLLLLLTANKR